MEQGSRLSSVLAAIDAANAADPTTEMDGAEAQPAALLYGQRMSAELGRLCPDASGPLQIAARGQHVERWMLRRDSYPGGRAGYLAWRTEQGRRHAERISGLMADAGYEPADRARVESLLRKEGIKRNPETQMLEDVICVVFLRWYFSDFAAQHDAAAVQRIVEKTARKMSTEARVRVLREFDLPETLATPFRN